MKALSYSVLLERLGPLPTVREVGEFIGGDYMRAYSLVGQGKLEALTTTGKARIVLNSLFQYLQELEAQEAAIQSCRSAIDAKLSDVERFEAEALATEGSTK